MNGSSGTRSSQPTANAAMPIAYGRNRELSTTQFYLPPAGKYPCGPASAGPRYRGIRSLPCSSGTPSVLSAIDTIR